MRKKSTLLPIALLLVVTCLSGCLETGSKPAAVEPAKASDNQQPKPAAAVAVKEAPMLHTQVTAGTLKPLDQRMPVKDDIMIEPVFEKIGKYGGEWRMPWNGADDKWTIGMPTEEAMFRFKQDGNGVEPNVAKGYEVNADSTVFKIQLRKGMKWSDGMPFTADDVIFYWEHMLLKETFGKALYDCYYSTDPVTGERARADVTKLDDYTVQVAFKHPNVLFLERLAIDNKWFFAPAHYYKTILPEFIGEEKALEMAKQYGFKDTKNFGVYTGYYFWLYPQRPTLRAWVAKNDANSDRFIMERNPYYFKTDKEGNQLPYIDRIVLTKMQDKSHKLVETLAGNADIVSFDFADFTVLKENEKKGNYRVIPWATTSWASTGIQLNQTTEDPKMRALFQDIRFREALSVAVNRKEVSEIVTNGLGEPAQASVPKGLPNYQEGWEKKWIEYDPARAGKLFDDIGLKWDAAHKFRTFADGSDLTLVVYNEKNVDNDKFIELLKKYFEAAGIKTDIKVADQSNYFELKYANKIPVLAKTASVVKVSFRPDELVPLRVLTGWFGHYGLFTQSKGKEGVQPTGDVAELLADWDKIKGSKTRDEIDKWSDAIVKLHMKNQWMIGYTAATPVLYIAKNNVKNVPKLINSDEFRGLGHAHPAQFFFE